MSKHNAQRAAVDPRAISPKVKAAGAWGAAITAALIVIAAFLQSIPADALADLGPWAAPVGAAIATLAAVLAAYAKGDPAREPSLYLDAGGGVYTDPGDAEVQRFVQGEYASNRVDPIVPQNRPDVEPPPTTPDGDDDPARLTDLDDQALAADSEAAAAELAAQLREQDDSTAA